eukprot:scaffold1790_cov257-Pinguiococcus_pyrenoidosus.AAC.37
MELLNQIIDVPVLLVSILGRAADPLRTGLDEELHLLRLSKLLHGSCHAPPPLRRGALGWSRVPGPRPGPRCLHAHAETRSVGGPPETASAPR